MAAAAPLWIPIGETRGMKLEMRPAFSHSRALNGASAGRSLQLKAPPAVALAALQPGERVLLPLPSGEEVTGRINLVQSDAGSWVRVGGELTGSRKGSFALSASPNAPDVDGIVLLPTEGLAFVVSNDATGKVTMEEKLIGELLCIPMPKAPVEAGANSLPLSAIATASIPVLSSRPSATAVIYLDFDGETVTDPRWAGGQTIVAAPANVSSSDVMQVWASVKEDFWAFNIDVTTDVNRYNNAPVNRRTRCIVTPTDTAAPGTGGVAYINCFSRGGTSTFSATLPCWVFVGGAKPIAEAVSHEVGHTLGLRHDGRSGEDYYAGHGGGAVGWAPIMGVGYYRELVQWSKGEYPNASNTEDDLAIIASSTNGFGFVADEAGNTASAAATLNMSGSSINQAGVISQASDVDFYRVTLVTGAALSLTANPAPVAPDLDLLVQLQDAGGNVLASSNPDTALGATLNASVYAGTYYVRVAGVGRGSVAGDGYSAYGSIGAYTLTGAISGAAQAPSIGGLNNLNATAGTLTSAMAFTIADADTDVNALTLSGSSSNPSVIPNSNIFFGGSGANRSVTLWPAVGQSGAATITVQVSDGALTTSATFSVNVTPALSAPVFTSHPASQAVAVGASVSFTAGASGSPSYQWFKNGAPIGGQTSSSFTIAAAALSDAATYTVSATNGAGTTLSSAASLTVNNGGSTSPLLGGAVISSAPYANIDDYRGAQAFDGSGDSFFAGRPEDALVFVGRDLGAAKRIERIRYLPRNRFNWRMNAGVFRGANAADFSDAVTLATIAFTPPEGVWQEVTLPASATSYRYVYFTTSSANEANVAELEFYGSFAPDASSLLAGAVISTAPYEYNSSYRGANAFDGSGASFFAGRPEDSFVYVGRDFAAPKLVNRIRYLPRTGFNWRMEGGVFRGANAADLSDAVTLHTVAFTPPENVWQEVNLPASATGYRYVFFTTASRNEANVAELEFHGSATPVSVQQLDGAVISTAPYEYNQSYRGANAFDGSGASFFAGRPEDSFVYVGRDFGAAKFVTRIRYFPRTGFNWRMNSGQFRGANAPDLSDAVTLHTIGSTPPENTWQDIAVTAGSYRYVFFTTISSNEANIAELEIYGSVSNAAEPVQNGWGSSAIAVAP